MDVSPFNVPRGTLNPAFNRIYLLIVFTLTNTIKN